VSEFVRNVRLWFAPQEVREEGRTPDYRFSLANERTFLAGIRTALALLAAGVALEALAVPVEPRLRLAAALVLVGLACVSTVHAARSWARTERAMRLAAPMPSAGRLTAVLAVGVFVAGVLLLVGFFLVGPAPAS
jgi:putative membrane protein